MHALGGMRLVSFYQRYIKDEGKTAITQIYLFLEAEFEIISLLRPNKGQLLSMQKPVQL